MADAGFIIPKKQRKQVKSTPAPAPAPPAPAPMDQEDPLLASLLDDRRPSSASATASASASAATTPTPSLSETPQSQQEGKGKGKGKKEKKNDKGKGSKKSSKSSKEEKRLIVPGAGHDDSFLFTLRAAGVEGHEYNKIILLDTLDAAVSEKDALAKTEARLRNVLDIRFKDSVQHDEDKQVLHFLFGGPKDNHIHLLYYYQCDPATLTTPDIIGKGDIYISSFARRPGLSSTGASGTFQPAFNPATWSEAMYQGRRVFVCEPSAPAGKGPLAAALPANVVSLSKQADEWAARLVTRDRNVLRDVIAHENGVVFDSDSDEDWDSRKKRARKTPPKRGSLKRPSPAQAAKKKQKKDGGGGKPAAAAAGAGTAGGKGKPKKSKVKTVHMINPFVR